MCWYLGLCSHSLTRDLQMFKTLLFLYLSYKILTILWELPVNEYLICSTCYTKLLTQVILLSLCKKFTRLVIPSTIHIYTGESSDFERVSSHYFKVTQLKGGRRKKEDQAVWLPDGGSCLSLSACPNTRFGKHSGLWETCVDKTRSLIYSHNLVPVASFMGEHDSSIT